MRLSISHETTYTYADQVRSSIQYLRLTPQESERQHVVEWWLDLPGLVEAQRDAYGNILHVLTLEQPHDSITIGARGVVEIDVNCEGEHDSGSPWPYTRTTALTEADPALREFALRICGEGRQRSDLIQLMHALLEAMPYSPGATDVESTAAGAFAAGVGVCQDHTHAFVACARSLGIPARYVSGYLYSDDLAHLASHAWAEAWLDGVWYCFDVTNGLSRPERHLKLAVGMDYLDACPVRGMRRGGGSEKMHAQVYVHPNAEQQQDRPEQQQKQQQQQQQQQQQRR
jgi:transglutaminase-like putative cysteine protease